MERDEFGNPFVLDATTGMWVRAGTYDLEMLKYKERLHYVHIPVYPDEPYLEVGGCCGFGTKRLTEISDRVYTVEPVKSSCKLIRLNAPMAIIEQGLATVEGTGRPVEIMLSNMKNFGTASNLITRGRTLTVRTRTVNFKELLLKANPTVIYMDCEGAEYSLLRAPLPSTVKGLCLEMHLNKKAWRQAALSLADHIAKQGFRCRHEPKLSGKHWSTVGSWTRR